MIKLIDLNDYHYICMKPKHFRFYEKYSIKEMGCVFLGSLRM